MRAIILALLTIVFASVAGAVPRYDIGNPTLQDVWIDPAAGNDANNGQSRATAKRTFRAAWLALPQNAPLTTGVRFQLVAGAHNVQDTIAFLENRKGTRAAPIVINSVDGPGRATMPSVTFFNAAFTYVLGIRFLGGNGGDGLQFEKGENILLRQVTVDGNATRPRGVQEALKVNQSRNVYIEESDFSGAGDNALDFVAVHYGHVLYSRFSDAQDWCAYAKGGSNDLIFEGNTFRNCGTGGFTAGQGTGLQFMDSPWLHYEAYNIKIINNLVFDVDGAAFGVNGGYNILIAYNTAVRVGRRSHILEVVHGNRSCDGNPPDAARCNPLRDAGAWYSPGPDLQMIPNKNVYVYNNVFYNPEGYMAGGQHFEIRGGITPDAQSGIPSPSRADDNVVIRGNVIWSPTNTRLGIEDGTGCQASNTTCNAAQLRADNAINTLEPLMVNVIQNDFQGLNGAPWLTQRVYTIPAFPAGGLPARPQAPATTLDNTVANDGVEATRGSLGPAGYLASVRGLTPAIGWWWNEQQSGRGFFIERQGNNIFMAGYLYETTGRATWFTAFGPLQGNTFSADMATARGGQTLTGAFRANVAGPSLGRINITFATENSGTITWPGGTLAITRYGFGLPGVGTSESGWYWNAQEPGRGFSIEIQGNKVFVVGFMYDDAGNPVWYVSEGLTDQNRFSGAWAEVANGQSLTGAYRAPTVANANVGSLTLTYIDATNVTLTLPTGRQVALTRFPFR